MTSTGIKFYKFSNHTSSATAITSAKAVEGAIIYIVDLKEIWIGGATPKLAVAGSTDVTFSGNILTITTHNDNGTPTTQTLDFNDVASAQETFKVFEHVYQLMGTTASGTAQTLDYTGTNYLTSATNLVNADKALDTAIHDNTTMADDSSAAYDTEHLSSTWTTVVEANEIEAGDAVTADIEKLDKKVAQLANEVIANEQVTQEAFTAVANSVGLEQDMSLDLSSASSTGAIHNDTDVKSALIHLDNAISTNQLDVQVEGTSIVNNNVANLGVADSYNASTNKIATVATVTNAINTLDVTEYTQAEIDTTTTSGETAFKVKGIKEVDGKIAAGTNTVDVKIDGTYDATDNKIATKSTVTNAINALDVNTDKGAASISGSTITINAVQQENGLIKDGGSTTINLDGTYDASTNKIATKSTVSDAIEALDATNIQGVDYTAADASNGAKLTFKGISETDGVIAQGTGTTELQFAKVATTGAAADVSYINTTSHLTATNAQTAIDELDNRIDALEGSFDVIKSTDAANTPAGVTWIDDNQQTITGTLAASDVTFHKVYLVPVDSTGTNKYAEYITTRTGNEGSYVYGWERLGTIDVDLTGYVKTITANGTSHAVDSQSSTNVTLGNIINDVTGETAIAGGESGLVAVTPTNTTDANGVRTSDLATTVKIEEVADGIVKDNPASYTEGHYVIENGKLVSAVGKSDVDTYTISANDGLTKASDVAAYVESKTGEGISSLDVPEYQQASVEVDTTNHTSTLKIKGIKEDDGKIAAATTTPTTDVAIDGEYNATNNKIATQSTVSDIVENLDVAEYAQAEIDTTTSQTDTTITIKGIKEEDGEISGTTTNSDVDIEVNGIYNASTNKIATQSTVTNAISALDANPTSDDAAVANVQVVETDGVITDVVVTNVSAGVSYTPSTASSAPGLAASTATGAVTGADIATIKSYVDDKAALCWEAYE